MIAIAFDVVLYSTGIRIFNIATSLIIVSRSIENNRNTSTLSLLTDRHDRDLVILDLSRKARDRKTKKNINNLKNVYENVHRGSRYTDRKIYNFV